MLVVGGGESAADISAELGKLSPNVTVWLRRPICVGPRYLNSQDEMQQVASNEERDFGANEFLEAATTNRISAGLNVYFFGLFRRLLWHLPVLNSTLNRMDLTSTTSASLMNDQAVYVTKNSRMAEALHEKRIEALVCPNVTAKERTCEFDMPDGTIQQRDFDAVVLYNGFHPDFPWLRLKELDSNPRKWFLHCFPKDFGHCLSFVGYARPHQGGIPVMAEMLSRYIALLLRGERTLPHDYAAQARYDEVAEREYYFLRPEMNALVDYNAFLESVARRVGCEPRLPASCVVVFNLHILAVFLMVLGCFWPSLNPLSFAATVLLWTGTAAGSLVVQDGMLFKWWVYPNWSVWYRQRGPRAEPKLLSDVLQRVNLWTSTSVTRGFILLVVYSLPTFYMQPLLSLLVFVPYAILNALGFRFRRAWGGLLRPKIFALHNTAWHLSDLFLP